MDLIASVSYYLILLLLSASYYLILLNIETSKQMDCVLLIDTMLSDWATFSLSLRSEFYIGSWVIFSPLFLDLGFTFSRFNRIFPGSLNILCQPIWQYFETIEWHLALEIL